MYSAIRYFIWVKILCLFIITYEKYLLVFASSTNCWEDFLYQSSDLKLWLLIQLFMNSKIFIICKNRNDLNIIPNPLHQSWQHFQTAFMIMCFYNRPSISPFKIHNSVDDLETFKLVWFAAIFDTLSKTVGHPSFFPLAHETAS